MKRLFFLLLLVCFSFFVVSQDVLSDPSMCCEKTKSGGWCINEPEEECNSNFRMTPAACDATSYCRLGTCYDSKEGICYENTPQRVCEDSGGTWDSRELGRVPVCQLGCCIIAEEAAFVPLVRCKKLSTFFGVSIDYREDVESEMECVALANSQDVGACVYEKEYERVCEFTTRSECGAQISVASVEGSNESSGPERRFFKDYLCSAEELNTVCSRQATTACHDGRVYWYDSCGNRENVYSADEKRSWNNGRVADPDDVCPPNDGTNPNCGNCDYMLGSRCEAEKGISDGEKAFCQRTDCIDRWGNSRMNGESWCVNDGDSGNALDKAGSRYYREVCVDGEVRVEPCADYRNEICYESKMESSGGDFSVASCRVNRWQACIGIDEKNQCLNRDKRDCTWLDSPLGLLVGGSGGQDPSSPSSNFSNPTYGDSDQKEVKSTNPMTGNLIFGDDSRSENETTITNRESGVCVPQFPPGLRFWEEGTSQSVCGLVSARCVVEYTKGAFGDWECTDNCECLSEDWAVKVNRICSAQGDCGAYVNYIGKFTDGGYEWVSPSGKKSFGAGSESVIEGGFGTGDAVGGSFASQLMKEVAF